MRRAALIASLLLLGQEGLPEFVAGLERQREAGKDPKELSAAAEAWASGKSPDTRHRLEWNLGHYAALAEAESLYLDDLKGRAGQRVDVPSRGGKTGGKLAGVKDRTIQLEVEGKRIEVAVSSVPFTGMVTELKSRKRLPAASRLEALARAAAGEAGEAAELASKIPEDDARARTYAALAGLALQAADADLAARRTEKLGRDFAEHWVKHPALMAAADGALELLRRDVVVPRLLAGGSAALKLDRKAARRLLDLAVALAATPEQKREAGALLGQIVVSGDWIPIPIDAGLTLSAGKVVGDRIVWESEGEPSRGTRIRPWPLPAEQVTGIRATIRPGRAKSIGLAWEVDGTAKMGHLVALLPPFGQAAYNLIPGNGRETEQPRPPVKVGTKESYVLRIESGKGKLKLYVDAVEVESIDFKEPRIEDFLVYVGGGAAEITELALRKK